MSAAANEEATTAMHVCSMSADSNTDRDAAEPEADDLQAPSIYAGISALLGSDKFSDMAIRCGGREFKAHRAIVCSQSRFFDRALTGGFAVGIEAISVPLAIYTFSRPYTDVGTPHSLWQEAATGIVDLPEDDPDVVQRFLQFLYTGTYTDLFSTYAPPSDACMLSPEQIQDELNTPPGVQAFCPSDEVPDDEQGGDREAELSDTPPKEPVEPDEEYDSDESVNDEVSDAGGEAKSSNVLPHNRLATRLRELADDFYIEEKARQLHRDSHPQVELELLLPLRLYVMGDKFDVPALKVLARDRFYRAAELSWRVADCFPEVVDELYTNTPPTDVALREIVCRLVAVGIKDDDQRLRMEEVMRKHGDFAVGVMNYLLVSERLIWT